MEKINQIYITKPVEIQALLKSKIWIDIQPVDDWSTWSYRIYLEDSMCPFFEVKASDEGSEFCTYDLAFNDAIDWLIKESYLKIVTRIF